MTYDWWATQTFSPQWEPLPQPEAPGDADNARPKAPAFA